MLIDSYFFTKYPRKITNLTMGSNASPLYQEVRDFVGNFIHTYVPLYLSDLFGEEWGAKVLEHTINPSLHEDTKELDDLCQMLKEPCADYVFFYLLRETIADATMCGLLMSKTGEAHVTPIRKQTDTWNRMVKAHEKVKEWLSAKKEYFKGIKVSENILTPINIFNL